MQRLSPVSNINFTRFWLWIDIVIYHPLQWRPNERGSVLITSVSIVFSAVGSGADQSNIKAPRHWPLCGEFTGDRWIPRTKGK